MSVDRSRGSPRSTSCSFWELEYDWGRCWFSGGALFQKRSGDRLDRGADPVLAAWVARLLAERFLPEGTVPDMGADKFLASSSLIYWSFPDGRIGGPRRQQRDRRKFRHGVGARAGVFATLAMLVLMVTYLSARTAPTLPASRWRQAEIAPAGRLTFSRRASFAWKNRALWTHRRARACRHRATEQALHGTIRSKSSCIVKTVFLNRQPPNMPRRGNDSGRTPQATGRKGEAELEERDRKLMRLRAWNASDSELWRTSLALTQHKSD